MKKVMLIFAMLISLNLSAQLTHRGTRQMPAEILMASFTELQPGDSIFSAYNYEGDLHASAFDVPKPGRTNQFLIRCMGDDAYSPVKTGAAVDEVPTYILKRSGIFYLLNVERAKTQPYIREAALTLTDSIVTLNDNLYYSLCPEWPEFDELMVYKKPGTLSATKLDRVIITHEYFPQFTESIAFELVEGSGRLDVPRKVSNLVSSWKYRFTKADFDRGYIILLLKVDPLPNCENPIIQKQIKINL